MMKEKAEKDKAEKDKAAGAQVQAQAGPGSSNGTAATKPTDGPKSVLVRGGGTELMSVMVARVNAAC